MTTDRGLADVLCTDFPTLTADMPMRRAVGLLVQGKVSAAPVVDEGGSLQGILSQRDCFRAALNASYYQEWKGVVADSMSRSVVTLPVTADLATAAEAFLSHPYRIFPVVQGVQLVGMLRRSDVLAALLKLG